jgi:hypothetical protein
MFVTSINPNSPAKLGTRLVIRYGKTTLDPCYYSPNWQAGQEKYLLYNLKILLIWANHSGPPMILKLQMVFHVSK